MYEDSFGQQINRSKTMMNFSRNVAAEDWQNLMMFWGFTEQVQPDIYLGLLPVMGKKIKGALKYQTKGMEKITRVERKNYYP